MQQRDAAQQAARTAAESQSFGQQVRCPCTLDLRVYHTSLTVTNQAKSDLQPQESRRLCDVEQWCEMLHGRLLPLC